MKRAKKDKRSYRASTASSKTPQPKAKAQPSTEAIVVARSASQLYRKAHQLDKEADLLHGSIHVAHQTAYQLRSEFAAPAPGGEVHPIVIDEQQPERGKPFTVVGIGASAGGYEACAEFLRCLPKDMGMAFVLVQHLDPKHKSQLPHLLGLSSALPVQLATNDSELEPNRVYVIPENSNLTLWNGRLRLHPRRAHEAPPMPIDTFFRSLAQEQQNRAIGVILSGTGSDGTLGLEAIKGEGGITFAQDDRSSKYFGMPGSAIASGAVDFVLSPEGIARELDRIARHPGLNKEAEKKTTAASAAVRTRREPGDEIGAIFRLLRARTEVDFSLYKQSTLKRRILRRMILHKKDDVAQYIRFVEHNATELDALFNDLLINVTNFFRDPKTFQLLKKKIFPRILKAHTDESPIRFWVCGCSTGEEAYSLAMALVEVFDETRDHRPVQIFATDVSNIGIEKARAGIYPANIQQDVSPERLRRFFTKVNGNFQVQKSIRDMCVFARQNVLLDPPFSNLDLVSCRNVLIYFGPALQRHIIPLFHYALRNTGFLLLGNSETIGPSTEHFLVVDKKYKLYQKKTGFTRSGFDLAVRAPEKEPRPGSGVAMALEGKPIDLPQQIDKILLREFSPATIVVNSQMDVVHFRGRTGLFLEHASGTASLNLFKLLRESLTVAVRAALSKAMRLDEPVRNTGLELRHNGNEYDVSFEIVPFRIQTLEDRFFAIVFRERRFTSPEGAPRGKESTSAASARLRRDFAKLKLELVGTKESMQSIIEEQEATNEELKSANEEIQSSNEELQSTNEELETAKEELQSTNEELTTLNEELQTRNSELSQANNDLLNLLSSVNIAILIVGQDLTIRRSTPMAERLFNLIPSDVGRRLSDMTRSLLVPELDQTIRRVIDDLTVVERETQDRDGRWYMLRFRPYRTNENRIEGAVIVLIDLDEVRQALEVVMSMIPKPALLLSTDLRVRSVNQSFLESFNLASEQTVGQIIYQVGDKQWDLPQLHTVLEEVLPRQKKVTDFILEGHFPGAGVRKLRLNASRFFEEGKGIRLIFLTVEDA